jgi:hypothetical protein
MATPDHSPTGRFALDGLGECLDRGSERADTTLGSAYDQGEGSRVGPVDGQRGAGVLELIRNGCFRQVSRYGPTFQAARTPGLCWPTSGRLTRARCAGEMGGPVIGPHDQHVQQQAADGQLPGARTPISNMSIRIAPPAQSMMSSRTGSVIITAGPPRAAVPRPPRRPAPGRGQIAGAAGRCPAGPAQCARLAHPADHQQRRVPAGAKTRGV